MKKMAGYVPVMKTGDAELRGLANLSSDVKDRIVPLIELTRSRSSKNFRTSAIVSQMVLSLLIF